MSDTTLISFTETEGSRFPSIASLRAAHSDLLKRYRERENDPNVLAEIKHLIYQGQATGALLDSEDDRWAAQSLLDYWSSLLYRAGSEPPDTTLLDFDPTLAPNLSDELCPYLGLEAFREAKQHLFFGRQRLLDKLLKQLTTNRLLIVVGSSGSGKSSLVLGGLLPRLIAGAEPGSQDWVYYAPFVPGSDPLAALAQQLKPAHESTAKWVPQQVAIFKQDPKHLLRLTEQPKHQPAVLVIDQFEEVFTLCRQVETRQALAENLLNFIKAPDSANRLILTMRADFESQFVRTPELLSLFEQSYVRVTALDANELREAIEQPATMVGLKFEEGLVDALLSDVLGEPAALPLLQFTLLKLWDHRERNRVTWEAYRRLGGGRLALAKSADELYKSLIPEEQMTVRRILLRMVRPGEGLEVTSNRILRQELYRSGEAQDRIDRVLEKLIHARLVRLTAGDSQDDAQVEVAHEALIRNWPRLVDWLEEDRFTLRQRLRLTEAAEQWQARGQDASMLWRGALLEEAEHYSDLNPLEREFLKTSSVVEEARRQQEQKQLQFRKRATQGLIGLSVGTVCLLGGIVVYLLQQAQRQQIEQLAATSKSLLTTKPVEAEVYALASMGLSKSPFVQFPNKPRFVPAEGGMLDATQGNAELNRIINGAEANSVAFSPDGKTIVSGSDDKMVRLWNAQTGQTEGQLVGHDKAVNSVAFSPDGKTIVSGSEDNTVRLWDAQTKQPIGQPLTGHDAAAAVNSVAFSPDGKTIVSGSEDNMVRLWNAQTRQPIGQPLKGHSEAVLSVAFSPDGKTIVSGGRDNTVRLWNAQTRQPAGQPLTGQRDDKGHDEAVNAVAFSPDGKTIASGSDDSTVRLWDAQTRKPIGSPLSMYSDNAVLSVAFSPDSKTIIIGRQDKTVERWDAQTGQSIGQSFGGHGARVMSVAFSPDGKTIVSGSNDKTIRLWDAQTKQPFIYPFTGQGAEVTSSPDGKTMVSRNWDNTMQLWDAQTGKPIGQPLTGHDDAVYFITFSPDGKTLASSSEDKSVWLWNAQTGKPIGQPLTGHDDMVFSITFSPDGKTLASGSKDNTIRLWDAQTGQPIGQPLKGHDGAVSSITFDPDGKTLASGSWDNTVRLWNAQTGRPIGQPLKGHDNAVYSVAFSADGKTLASGTYDGKVGLWNVQTGQLIGETFNIKINWGLQHVAFSSDGKAVVVNFWDNTVQLWDAQTRKFIGQTRSVAFSPDGKIMVNSSLDRTVRLWNTQTGKPIGQPLTKTDHSYEILSVAFSPDGKIIASGHLDKTVRLWDAQTGKPIGQPLTGHEDAVLSVAFSPDGKTIASGSKDDTVRLWDAQTRKPFGESLAGHEDAVTSITFSPNSKTIASGSKDNTVRLWDAQTGKAMGKPLVGHDDAVTSIAFSPNSIATPSGSGYAIVSGSDDQTLRLWDIQTMQPIGQPFTEHYGTVLSVAFSPDGKTIASSSEYSTVQLWDTQTGKPIGQALTVQEYYYSSEGSSVAFSPDGKSIISGGTNTTIGRWNVFPEEWLHTACNQLQYHSILTDPPSDLQNVARQAKGTCQRYVWSKQ